MYINNTSSNINHTKSILESLKSTNDLPFSEILSPETICEYLQNIEFRNRIYTPEITLWALLSQVLNADQSLQAAVLRVISFFADKKLDTPSVNTSAYSQARARLSEELLSNLVRDSAQRLENIIPSRWFWQGKSIKLIDGTHITMADTDENQKVYPQNPAQKSGVGFPIMRIVAVISYATGAILDIAMGPYSGKSTGEHALLRQIMHTFKVGDVVVGDRYYASFFLMATLKKMGVEAVFPIHGGRGYDFRKGKRIGKKDHIVEWEKPQKPDWMDLETYNRLPEKIEIREASIQTMTQGFRPKTRIIVTTNLNFTVVSKQELGGLYERRWCVELDLRTIKATIGMGVLRSKTVAMVRKEIWAYILAYNLIRKIMAQSAYLCERNPRDLSFKLAMQAFSIFRELFILQEKNENYILLLKLITYKKVGNRPGRREPRLVKRRPITYKLLQRSRRYYQERYKSMSLS